MSKTELLVIIGFSIILTSIAIPNIKKYKFLRECIQNNKTTLLLVNIVEIYSTKIENKVLIFT